MDGPKKLPTKTQLRKYMDQYIIADPYTIPGSKPIDKILNQPKSSEKISNKYSIGNIWPSILFKNTSKIRASPVKSITPFIIITPLNTSCIPKRK